MGSNQQNLLVIFGLKKEYDVFPLNKNLKKPMVSEKNH